MNLHQSVHHTTTPAPRARRSRHAGTAMMETVLVLPLIFVVLGLIFWFGGAFEREQQQRMLVRYDAARAGGLATPAAPATQAGLNDGQTDAMNQLFFDSRAQALSPDWETYASPAADLLMLAAANHSTPTGDLAQRILSPAPRGVRVKLLADFTSGETLAEAVAGPMLRRSVHPGPSWAYADAMHEEAPSLNIVNPPLTANWVYRRNAGYLRADSRVRDVFYAEFDRQLSQFPEPASRMVSMIRGILYASQPGYRGPTVNFAR